MAPYIRQVTLPFNPPKGMTHLFKWMEFSGHLYYLECRETQKYLAHTKRSEFLLNWHDTIYRDIKPVTFATYEEAQAYADKQDRRIMKCLSPRPLSGFFLQYLKEAPCMGEISI